MLDCIPKSLHAVSVENTAIIEPQTEYLGNAFLLPDLSLLDKDEFSDRLDDIVRKKWVYPDGARFGPFMEGVGDSDGCSRGHDEIVKVSCEGKL